MYTYCTNLAARMDAIDWPGIRAASVTLGIRGAARQAAAHLQPEEQNRFVQRTMQRAYREGWQSAKLAVVPTQPAHTMPLSAPVSSGAVAAQNGLLQQGERTKFNLSKAAEKASTQLVKLPGSKLLRPDIASSAKQWTGVAGTVHGWQDGTSTTVNIALLSSDGSMD